MPGCKQFVYIIQVKGFSWPYLISKILVTYNAIAIMLLLIGLALFTVRLFLFSILIIYTHIYINFVYNNVTIHVTGHDTL